jgi:heme/copper-type cytochrome/quinol oxidase subunit 2
MPEYIATEEVVTRGTVASERMEGEDEEEGNVGLLVGAIILMVIVVGLFAYLMLKERAENNKQKKRMATGGRI